MLRLLTTDHTTFNSALQARAQKQRRERKLVSMMLGIVVLVVVVLGFVPLGCLALHSRGCSCAARAQRLASMLAVVYGPGRR